MATTTLRRSPAPLGIRVDSLEGVDRVLRSMERRISELETRETGQGVLLKDVELPDSANKALRHGLNRKVQVFVSPVWDNGTTGRVERISAATAPDDRNWIILKGTGFGAVVKVDVWIT